MRSIVGTARYWGPLVAAFVCLIAALYAGPIVGFLLTVLAFGLIFDGATAAWARSARAGGLTSHRQ